MQNESVPLHRERVRVGARIMNRKSLRLATMILALIAVVLLWPIRSLEAPEWKVRVVDRAGKPVRDVVVRESCRNYSAEFGGHEVDLRPDDQGNVTFSKQVIRVPIVKRLFVTAQSATAGAHASFGPHCFILAFGGNLQSTSPNWNRSPSHVESTLVVYPYIDSGNGQTGGWRMSDRPRKKGCPRSRF